MFNNIQNIIRTGTAQLAFFAAALLLFSCDLNKKAMLDQYWDELVKSKTEKEETAVLQKLAGYLQDHQISFEIFKDINGTLKDLGSISPADSLYPVTVKFQEPGSNAESVKSGWHPKSDDNTFFLYRE